MNYGQALEYVRSLSSRGIVPGLDSIRELCKRLGNPQKATKWIHVAGTNGKGSAVAYISTILFKAGYRVGCYVSPTIRDYRERICVNGGMISKVALAEGMTLVKEACDAMVSEGLPQPTPFEVETALAFWCFQKKKCDLGVLECGMGGRWDATSAVKSIEKIAAQKAGIIKPGSAVVCMEQRGEVLKVIEEKAKKEGASLFISRSSAATKVQYGLEKQSFHYGKHGKLTIRLAGKFQIDNAVLAVDACEALKGLGIRISDEGSREGLLETRWDGRLTVVQKHPMMVIDGAHNEDAAQKLAKSIEMYFTNRRIIYIMGVLRDKDFDRIIELTHSYADQIITVTPPENPRALPALDLAQEVAKVHPSVTAAASLEEAVEMARLLADKDDVILAFGSLSYLGKLMDIVGYPAKTPK